MNNKFKILNIALVVLVAIVAFSSCAGPSLKKNKIYVTGTDVMGEPVVDKELFKSFNQFPDATPVDFPEAWIIKIPDGTEVEGKRVFQTNGNNYSYAKYELESKNLIVTVLPDGTVDGFEKKISFSESDTWEPVLTDEEIVEKAKELYSSYMRREIPEDCEVSVSWDYTPQRQKSTVSVHFNKMTEGYQWCTGIHVGMTANGEMRNMWDTMHVLSGKTVPSGFNETVEKQIAEWIKDKDTEFSLIQKRLLVSFEGKLIANVYVEIKPLDAASFGVSVIIPLE